METNQEMLVPEEAWPCVLNDLRRLGATPGEVQRVADMVDARLHDVAFALLDATFQRLRSDRTR